MCECTLTSNRTLFELISVQIIVHKRTNYHRYFTSKSVHLCKRTLVKVYAYVNVHYPKVYVYDNRTLIKVYAYISVQLFVRLSTIICTFM